MAGVENQNSSDTSAPPVPQASGISQSSTSTGQAEDSTVSTSGTVGSNPPEATVASGSSVDQDAAKKPPLTKRTPNDFIFGKLLGEGSYSTVYLAKEVKTDTEFAIKICDKKFIVKEKKTEYIMREKTVLTKLSHPFIIRLFYTFQDTDRLYFVLQYARKGELLYYLNKLSSFDMKCSRFYASEIVDALGYLHNQGVIHRDLKPENILLKEDMHIMITDFGSAKIVPTDGREASTSAPSSAKGDRRHSFVGTAQYVSPEVLNSKTACFSSDLWALGCIIFQFLSGETPFRGGHEYQIFQKVLKLEYEIPEGFNPVAADLVKKLLIVDPSERLGSPEQGGMDSLKRHEFFEGVDWDGLEKQPAPELMPYLPATDRNPEFWSNQSRKAQPNSQSPAQEGVGEGSPRPTSPQGSSTQSELTGFDDRRLAEIIISNVAQSDNSDSENQQREEEERRRKLQEQQANNDYHYLVEKNLILKQGKVLKRKGLFARKRMLLLTEGPHLYYVDYTTKEKVLKGQIPWSESLRPEAKNFKIFFVHTPNRTYYLESRDSDAHDWEVKINEVWQRYYGKKE